MKKCVITVRDEVTCFITNLQPLDIEELEKRFSVYVDGYRFMPAFKLGRWDGKKKFFEKTGKTYLSFLPSILEYLDSKNYEFDLVDLRKPVENPKLRATADQFAEFGISLRPYQVDSVNILISAGTGFVIAGTGAGKSLICASIVDIYGKSDFRTITIVPSSDLVSQTAEWYVQCGIDAGEYSGGKKEIDCQHIVATWQSLQNNPHLMELFQMCIVDEAHGLKGQVVYDLITTHGKNIPFRFGVTGTFPKSQADQMTLRSTIGEIQKEIPAKWLIENHYLAKVEIEPVLINVKADVEDFPDYGSEKAFLSKSEERLNVIADLIISGCMKYGNTLVLVNSVEMGKTLHEMISDSVFLYGNNDKKERKDQYDQYAVRDDIITIATFGIASTGISIDRIFHLIMIDVGKSFIRAIQTIGRGTRLASDKDSVYVRDVYSNLKWSKKHAKERKKYYDEAGYPVLPTVKINK